MINDVITYQNINVLVFGIFLQQLAQLQDYFHLAWHFSSFSDFIIHAHQNPLTLNFGDYSCTIQSHYLFDLTSSYLFSEFFTNPNTFLKHIIFKL